MQGSNPLRMFNRRGYTPPITVARLVSILLMVVVVGVTVASTADAAGTSTTHMPPSAFQQSEDAEALMLDEPVQALPVVDDARWSSAWTDSTSGAALVWIIFLIVLGFAGRPLARLLFRGFPDAGQGFARIVLILGAAWLVWALASYSVIEFRAIWS
ncbi:MAG: hypothetical protein KC438_15385, partial [Thermomicrobiales bacterium]|nr:hypothetical protein [Thermomicrobiales bacterium]